MKKEYANYLLEKNKKDYNLISDIFSKKRERIWPEMKFLFDDYLVPGEKVLDLGCGNGRFYEVMKDYNPPTASSRSLRERAPKKVDYIGVDISEKLIKIAKEKYPKVKFLVADALNLPFPNNYFDKVYAIAFFHHIPSKEYRLKVLKEIKRVLNKNRLLILTAWNLWKNRKARVLFFRYSFLKLIGWSKLDFKDIFYPWKNPKGEVVTKRYFHLFNEKELGAMLKKAGFTVEKILKNDNIVAVAKK